MNITRTFVTTLLATAALLLQVSLPAQAAPTYQSVSLDYAQTGLTIGADIGGQRLWTVEGTVTNNTGAALGDVNFWLLGLLLNSGAGLQEAAWDNTQQRFEAGNDHVAPDGQTAFLQFGLSDLVAPASSSIDASDEVGTWNLGALGVGQSVAFSWAIQVNTAVIEVRPNTNNYVGFTNTVPEPASVALAGLALLALVGARRRA